MGFEFSEEDVRRQVQGDGTGGAGTLRSSAKAFVTFRMWAAQDGQKTAERGYPAFRDAVYFSRRGEKNDGVDKEATEEHFREYAAEYAQFKEWMKDPQFPVYVLPYLAPHVLRLLDAGEITTVQELALAPNLTFRDNEGRVSQRVSIDAVPEEERHLALHEDHGRLAVADQVGRLVGRDRGIDEHRDAARVHDRVVGDRRL